jgi:hypothetical protein
MYEIGEIPENSASRERWWDDLPSIESYPDKSKTMIQDRDKSIVSLNNRLQKAFIFYSELEQSNQKVEPESSNGNMFDRCLPSVKRYIVEEIDFDSEERSELKAISEDGMPMSQLESYLTDLYAIDEHIKRFKKHDTLIAPDEGFHQLSLVGEDIILIELNKIKRFLIQHIRTTYTEDDFNQLLEEDLYKLGEDPVLDAKIFSRIKFISSGIEIVQDNSNESFSVNAKKRLDLQGESIRRMYEIDFKERDIKDLFYQYDEYQIRKQLRFWFPYESIETLETLKHDISDFLDTYDMDATSGDKSIREISRLLEYLSNMASNQMKLFDREDQPLYTPDDFLSSRVNLDGLIDILCRGEYRNMVAQLNDEGEEVVRDRRSERWGANQKRHERELSTLYFNDYHGNKSKIPGSSPVNHSKYMNSFRIGDKLYNSKYINIVVPKSIIKKRGYQFLCSDGIGLLPRDYEDKDYENHGFDESQELRIKDFVVTMPIKFKEFIKNKIIEYGLTEEESDKVIEERVIFFRQDGQYEDNGINWIDTDVDELRRKLKEKFDLNNKGDREGNGNWIVPTGKFADAPGVGKFPSYIFI